MMRDPLRGRRSDEEVALAEAERVLSTPGAAQRHDTMTDTSIESDSVGDAAAGVDAEPFRWWRTWLLLIIMAAVGLPAAGAIGTFIVLFTVLAVMTVLNGGVVPVGNGGHGASGIVAQLILFYTQGLGIAVTVVVMVLAVVGGILILPWAHRRRRRQ
jgi:hypothetical protein